MVKLFGIVVLGGCWMKMMLGLEGLHVAKDRNNPWDSSETSISVECGKIHDMNNVNHVNIDFICNYIHWESCCLLYFLSVLWVQVVKRKSEGSERKVREYIF